MESYAMQFRAGGEFDDIPPSVSFAIYIRDIQDSITSHRLKVQDHFTRLASDEIRSIEVGGKDNPGMVEAQKQRYEAGELRGIGERY
jgi:hypothetical protein